MGIRIRPKTIIICSVVVVLALIIGLSYKQDNANPAKKALPATSNSVPQSVINSVNFPVYYPASLPSGYQFNGAEAQGTIVNLFYSFDGSKQLIITQQPKPVLIEEVTKTKEFSTTIGEAYLANLNGRTVGFVRTEKTLIILTSASEFISSDIEQLMLNLQLAR